MIQTVLFLYLLHISVTLCYVNIAEVHRKSLRKYRPVDCFCLHTGSKRVYVYVHLVGCFANQTYGLLRHTGYSATFLFYEPITDLAQFGPIDVTDSVGQAVLV